MDNTTHLGRGLNFSISIPADKMDVFENLQEQVPRRKRSAWVLEAVEEKLKKGGRHGMEVVSGQA